MQAIYGHAALSLASALNAKMGTTCRNNKCITPKNVEITLICLFQQWSLGMKAFCWRRCKSQSSSNIIVCYYNKLHLAVMKDFLPCVRRLLGWRLMVVSCFWCLLFSLWWFLASFCISPLKHYTWTAKLYDPIREICLFLKLLIMKHSISKLLTGWFGRKVLRDDSDYREESDEEKEKLNHDRRKLNEMVIWFYKG